MIQVKNLSKKFDDAVVLDNITFDVAEGTSLVVLGKSGTGKSVLIKTIIGLLEPDKGHVILNNINITNLDINARLKLMSQLGFLFQNGALFDSLNVQDNITFYVNQTRKILQKEQEDIAVSKLKLVGLSADILKMYPSELSGGMQKRVALARAICDNPKIIFFDEPTTGLDPIMSNVINEIIVRVREELNATTITITHDISSARIIATDIAFLDKGQILCKGKKIILDSPDNKTFYDFINGITNNNDTKL